METQAKTVKGLFQSYIKEAKRTGNVDVQLILEEMLVQVEQIQKENTVQVDLVSWRGKDKISFIEKVDSFIIETHQRPDQDSEVKTSKKIIFKDEINQVINAINQANKFKDKEGNEYTETPEIAEKFCINSNLSLNHKEDSLFPNGSFDWDNFFSDRNLHNRLNLTLRLLDHYSIIKYRGKRIWVLNNKFKFQLGI